MSFLFMRSDFYPEYFFEGQRVPVEFEVSLLRPPSKLTGRSGVRHVCRDLTKESTPAETECPYFSVEIKDPGLPRVYLNLVDF